MNFRSITSLVLILVTVLLGACASSAKMLPNGNWWIPTTAGDTWDRSHTKVGEYECTVDKDTGKPIIGKCRVASNVAQPETVHGQTVAGQVTVAAMGGVGGALVNGSTARSVAEKQCKSNCGPVFNNQVQSIAEALNDNKVKIGVNSGTAACAATNSCGK